MPEALSQRDPRWANVKLGTSNTTIHDYGCTLTALTMLLNHYGGNYTPDQVNEKMKSVNGFSNGNLIIWSAIPKAFPQVKSAQRIWSYDNELVKSNIPVMVEVDGSRIGASKHWVLYIGNQRMNDPWYGNEKATSYYAPTGCAVLKVEQVEKTELSDDSHDCQEERYKEERDICSKEREVLIEENKNLKIQLDTAQQDLKTYQNRVEESYRELCMILDPNTKFEIASEQLIKNLAKGLVQENDELLKAKKNLEVEQERMKKEYEEEIYQQEQSIKSLKSDLDTLIRRVERVEAENERLKEKKESIDTFWDKVLKLFNKG